MITTSFIEIEDMTYEGNPYLETLYNSDSRVEKSYDTTFLKEKGAFRRKFNLRSDPWWIIQPFRFVAYPQGWCDLPTGLGKDKPPSYYTGVPTRYALKLDLHKWTPKAKSRPVLQVKTVAQFRKGRTALHWGTDANFTPDAVDIVVPKDFKLTYYGNYNTSGQGKKGFGTDNAYIQTKIHVLRGADWVDTHIVIGWMHIDKVNFSSSKREWLPGERLCTTGWGGSWHIHIETFTDHQYFQDAFPPAKGSYINSKLRAIPFIQVWDYGLVDNETNRRIHPKAKWTGAFSSYDVNNSLYYKGQPNYKQFEKQHDVYGFVAAPYETQALITDRADYFNAIADNNWVWTVKTANTSEKDERSSLVPDPPPSRMEIRPAYVDTIAESKVLADPVRDLQDMETPRVAINTKTPNVQSKSDASTDVSSQQVSGPVNLIIKRERG